MRLLPLLAPALVLAASAALGAPGEERFLDCGQLAPFAPTCGDCCEDFGDGPRARATMLGFEGRLDIRLQKVGSSGDSLVWHCWSILVPELPATPASAGQDFLGACDAEPDKVGHIRKNDAVRLDCWVSPLAGPVQPAPLGPYGCRVDLPD